MEEESPTDEAAPEKKAKAERVEIESTPGGPAFGMYRFNCKTYALSVLKEVGIQDESLENFGINNPAWSGELTQFTFREVENETLWDTSPSLSKRADFSDPSLTDQQIKSMQFSIRCNELRLLRQDLLKLLNDKTLSKIPGVSALKKEVEDLQQFLNDLNRSREHARKSKTPWPDEGDNQSYQIAIDGLRKRIEEFGGAVDKQKYPLSIRLLDTLKRAFNYLGTSFNLSTQHKSRKILSQYGKSVRKTREALDLFDPAKHTKPKKPGPR